MWPLVLLVLIGAFSAAASAGDAEEILEGVRSIGAPGVPGPLSVVGRDAFVLVAGGSGKIREPVVAAARWGKGRVVAFGHGGYFDGGAIKVTDTGRLLTNATRWLAGGTGDARVLAVRARTLGRMLGGRGFAVKKVKALGPAGDLRGVEVLCVDAARLTDERVREAVGRFVKGGGGLLTAGLGWGWSQLNPRKDLATEFPGNLLLAEAGIVWADGYLSRTSGEGFSVAPAPGEFLHAGAALDALAGEERLSAGDASQATGIVIRACRSVPSGDRHLLPALLRLAKRDRDQRGRLEQVLTAWEIHRIPWSRPEDIRAHPSAAGFPGALPQGASLGEAVIVVEHSVPGWQSTGLYAPPGGQVSAVLPNDAVRAGLRLRIGCHKDRLWAKEKWKRAPEITHAWPLVGAQTRAASPFGGLVYIEGPDAAPEGRTEIRVSGCARAPWFVLGETDQKEWREKIRKLPAPWAELSTAKVVLTVPSEVARRIEDPVALMTFWDRVMDACADLAVRPRERRRPERYVADIQISAGYMHAGYPIMTHLDAAEAMTHLPSLLGKGPHGNWGLYHEMGHNHQSRDWTFNGATEVTVNLFSLYVLETLCGVTDGHRGVRDGPKAMADYMKAGADFDVWKKKPFLALYMYAQLKQAFGWEAFKKVFREYRDLPPGERPKNDAQKRDQWMVRFSRCVGKNLGPFFKVWGVPVSAPALKSIEELPAWLPAELRRQG